MKEDIILILSEGCDLSWTAELKLGEVNVARDRYIPFGELMSKHTFFSKFNLPVIGYKIGNTTANQKGYVVIVEDYDSDGRGGLKLAVENKDGAAVPLINDDYNN